MQWCAVVLYQGCFFYTIYLYMILNYSIYSSNLSTNDLDYFDFYLDVQLQHVVHVELCHLVYDVNVYITFKFYYHFCVTTCELSSQMLNKQNLTTAIILFIVTCSLISSYYNTLFIAGSNTCSSDRDPFYINQRPVTKAVTVCYK